MLPEGWRTCRLEEIARVTSGGTPNRAQKDYWGGGIPWVTTGEISKTTIHDTAETITTLGLKNSAAKIFPVGTLLMAMYGEGKTRGQIARLSIAAATNQACAAILPQPDIDGEFLYQNLSSRYVEIRNLANDGSQKNLSSGLIKSLSIDVPPLLEQRRIAEILSTWDRAIIAVGALIANAQAQKNGLMQSLLTGQKRLPGFGQAWERKTLDQILTFKNGLNGEKSLYGTGVKFVNVMDVFQGPRLRHDIIKGSMQVTTRQTEEYSVTYGDVLFNRTSETDDEIALTTVYLDTRPAVFGGFVIRGRPRDQSLLPQYAAYAFRSNSIRGSFIRLGQGAIRANIGQGDLNTVEIALPPVPEQRRIAEVLSSCDEIIETLEKLIADTRAEKTALMQQLLTGKRRVNVNKKEAA